MAARLLRTMPGAPRSASRPALSLEQRLTDRLLAGELGPIASAVLCTVSPSARECLQLWRAAEQSSVRRARAVATTALAVVAARSFPQDRVDEEFWRIVADV